MKQLVCFLILCLGLTLPARVHAQEETDPVVAARNKKLEDLSASLRRSTVYRLGQGDVIELRVFGVSDFTHVLRINAAGVVSVPLVGPVHAAGKTAAELASEFETILDGNLFRNPEVSIFIREYHSQVVYVLGAVRQPGQYSISRNLSLVDVLALAGGLNVQAGDEAVIQRKTEAQARQETSAQPVPPNSAEPADTVRVDLRELLDQGIVERNVAIKGGDVIQVPARDPQVYYVIGEVFSPGMFEVPKDQNLLVTQALAKAGGPMKTAKMGKGLLVRFDENGEREELRVDYSSILNGRKPDFEVGPDDVIFIPGSTFKNVGYAMLGVVPGTLARLPRMVR